MTATADVLVIGIIGGSVAFHLLAREPRLRVTLLEREAETGTGSTAKATGGLRFQFSPAIGILMAEVVLDGRASSMDIDALSLDRFGAGRLRAGANMF